MAIDFYDIFRPCAILYPISPTVASTSAKKIHEWRIYRLYIFLTYLAAVGVVVAQIYIFVFVHDMPWSLMNKPMLLTLQCLFYTILLAQSLMGAKKNKIKKLMDEICELDEDNSINERKYKIYNGVFATAILINHVGGAIVNINNYEGTNVEAMFLVSLTIINILSDSEILVFTNFVSILNAKMTHLVSQLENIVKNKEEASKKEFYEQYRQCLYILKRINNIWQWRIFAIISFELYFTTRTVLKLFFKNRPLTNLWSVLTMISKYSISFRKLVVYCQLGLLGQWMAERFDQISQLANTISDMDLGDELNHQMKKISRLAAVCPGRIRAGSLVVDGQLPLQAVSAVISTVILMLQFGLNIY